MAGNLILDTNVFYDLGAGSLTPSDIGDADRDSVVFAALSVLQICGKMVFADISVMRPPPILIITSGAERTARSGHLSDAESVPGYALKRPPVTMILTERMIKAMADSHEMKSLVSGVSRFLPTGLSARGRRCPRYRKMERRDRRQVG